MTSIVNIQPASTMKRPSFLFISCIIISIILTNQLYAQPGALDPSFGTGGTVLTPINGTDDRGFAVTQQTDGKLVTAGFTNNGTNNDIGLIRYNPDGSLDAGFGLGGTVTTPIGSGNESAQAVMMQPDGKILVAGFTHNGSNMDFAVLRYLQNGNLDTTFGTGGITTTDILSGNNQAHSIALQTDGKILLAGFYNDGTDDDFAVVRYDSTGTLDLTFGGTGIVVTDFTGGGDAGRSVAVQPDGKIVVGGWASIGINFDYGIARYNTNGTLDNSFDTDGLNAVAIGPADDQGYSVVIQPDGKIILTGVTNNGLDQDFGLVRFNTNGSLDNTFDTDGIVTTDFFVGNDLAYSADIQTDGKILAAGKVFNGSGFDFGLARYLTDGSLDNSFDTDGRVFTNFGGANDVGWAVTIQSDERAVVVGSGSISNPNFAGARYFLCGVADDSVTQSGITLTANLNGVEYQWVNCDSVFSEVPGEVNQIFTATMNGSYAVVLNVSNCFDTSACYTINTVGLFENPYDYVVTLYPNPTNGQFFMNMDHKLQAAQLKIISITGQVMFVQKDIYGNNLSFDISLYPSGIYFVELTDGPDIIRTRVIKR